MDIKKKINLVKKNFYLAIFVVVLLFVIGFVIAAYDATKASHETLYTNRIEPKTGSDVNVVGNFLVNGQPFGLWAVSGGNIYYNLGNVGIGVTAPGAKLDVAGGARISGDIDISGSNRWIIHSPDDGRTTLYIAPWGTTGWNWGAETRFANNGSVYFSGNVGIGTTTPSEKLVVNGNIKASGTVCDSNGCIGESKGTPPLEFEVYNPDTTTYECVEKDLKEYCGDEDGCTIRLLLQHETDGSDQVRIIDEHIYMEQTSLSNNRGAGIYGYTRQGGGGEAGWITGTSNRYEIFSPWGWVWAFNYRHDWCPGQLGNGPAFSNPYNFNFMSHPNVRTTIIVYDSIGGNSSGGRASLPTCLDGQILKYSGGAWVCSDGGSGSGGGWGGWVHSGFQVYNGAAPTTWTDLNLASQVGSKRVLVLLKVVNPGNGVTSEITFKTKGDAYTDLGFPTGGTRYGGGTSGITLQGTPGNTYFGYLILETDDGGIVQWKSTNSGTHQIVLVGYIVMGGGGGSSLDLTNCAWTAWGACRPSGSNEDLICPTSQVMRGFNSRGCTSISPPCDDPTRCEQYKIYCCG